MSRVCDLTGRSTTAGKSRKHKRGRAGGVSGRWSRKAPASNRTFRPNLTRGVRVVMDGVEQKMTLSNKVVKRMKRFGHYRGVTLAVAA